MPIWVNPPFKYPGKAKESCNSWKHERAAKNKQKSCVCFETEHTLPFLVRIEDRNRRSVRALSPGETDHGQSSGFPPWCMPLPPRKAPKVFNEEHQYFHVPQVPWGWGSTLPCKKHIPHLPWWPLALQLRWDTLAPSFPGTFRRFWLKEGEWMERRIRERGESWEKERSSQSCQGFTDSINWAEQLPWGHPQAQAGGLEGNIISALQLFQEFWVWWREANYYSRRWPCRACGSTEERCVPQLDLWGLGGKEKFLQKDTINEVKDKRAEGRLNQKKRKEEKVRKWQGWGNYYLTPGFMY